MGRLLGRWADTAFRNKDYGRMSRSTELPWESTKPVPLPIFSSSVKKQAHDENKPLRQDPKIILTGPKSSYKNVSFNHFWEAAERYIQQNSAWRQSS